MAEFELFILTIKVLFLYIHKVIECYPKCTFNGIGSHSLAPTVPSFRVSFPPFVEKLIGKWFMEFGMTIRSKSKM